MAITDEWQLYCLQTWCVNDCIVAHTENLHNYKVEGHAVNILYTGKCTIVANGHLESHANFEVGI